MVAGVWRRPRAIILVTMGVAACSRSAEPSEATAPTASAQAGVPTAASTATAEASTDPGEGEPRPDLSSGTPPRKGGGPGGLGDDRRLPTEGGRRGDKLAEDEQDRTGADPLGAVALPAAKQCMRDCIDRNTMRAAGAAEIVSACRAQCVEQCKARCDAEAPGRASSFGTTCRDDCVAEHADAGA
jgi:hypothetical protein